MVQKAREKTQHMSNVSISIGNVDRLPFPDATFDVVLISDALHHLSCPEQALHEVRRVLKKDGLFLLVDPAKETPIIVLLGWLLKPIEKAYRYYSQSMLKKLLEQEEFRVTDIERHFLNNFVFATTT